MGLMFYSPTATQKYTLEDRKAGKPEAIPAAGPSARRVVRGAIW